MSSLSRLLICYPYSVYICGTRIWLELEKYDIMEIFRLGIYSKSNDGRRAWFKYQVQPTADPRLDFYSPT